MTRTAQPKQPRTASWRFKSAGHVLIWIGAFVAIFVTVALAATGGVDTTRYNRPGIIGAALILAAAAACFAASRLAANRPSYHDTAIEDADDYDLVETAR